MSYGVKGCPHCGGEGYVTGVDGAWARATVCSCVETCVLCDGAGRRLVEQDGSMRLARCRCRLLPDRIELFNGARFPGRHHNSSFNTFNKGLPDVMEGFVQSYKWTEMWTAEMKGLVLHGDVGRGKTHLLIAAMRELVFRHGIRVRFVEFTHLLGDLKAGFDQGRSAEVLLNPLVEYDVLAIDELGRGRCTEWEMGVLDTLISKRYNSMKQIVGTTNYGTGRATGQVTPNLSKPAKWDRSGESNQPTLADRVGRRVYSRLREVCAFVPVSGQDFRERMG